MLRNTKNHTIVRKTFSFFFRVGKTLSPILLVLISVYLFKKGQRKLKYSRFVYKTNQIKPEENLDNSSKNNLFINNLQFNPEIVTTITYVMFVTMFISAIVSANYFNFLDQNIITSFIPPVMINFVLPLYMYVKNSSLRIFVSEDVFTFLKILIKWIDNTRVYQLQLEWFRFDIMCSFTAKWIL